MDARGHSRRQRAGRGLARRFVGALLALAVLGLAGPAAADRYDPKRAGHPLRILAYVLHPVGVTVDYLVLRPAHWIGSHEPFSTLFGHEDGE